MFGKFGFFYSLILLFLAVSVGAADREFTVQACRCAQSRTIRCEASAIGVPVNRRLIAISTVAAIYAGIAGALFTQNRLHPASLDVFAFERSADLMLVYWSSAAPADISMAGSDRRGRVQDRCRKVSDHHAAILAMFWIGPVLVEIRAGRPRAHPLAGRSVGRTILIRQVSGLQGRRVAVPESDAL